MNFSSTSQGKTSRFDTNLQNNFDPLKVLLARD